MIARYYKTGAGASANVLRQLVEDGIPVEHAYLDQGTGMWIEHPAVVDRIMFEPAVTQITMQEAQTIVFMREATEPEWIGEAT